MGKSHVKGEITHTVDRGSANSDRQHYHLVVGLGMI
jgi:hypothetical protein